MSDWHLAPVESRFARLVWENAPMSTSELVSLCAQELQWKRTTTYTVLKKLSERGFFQVEKGNITVLISREEYEALQSTQFVRESFSGSLPAFLAAFTRRQKLTVQEADQLREMLRQYEEDSP